MDKQYFIDKYNIKDKITKHRWSELEAIYSDYCNRLSHFSWTADALFSKIANFKHLHSIRKRVKDPEHLIEKIIRKKNEDINVSNYTTKITDLVGIRILHLYKDDWSKIHEQLQKMSSKGPKEIIANYRLGDDIREYEIEYGIKTHEHNAGYRSVHYIIEQEYNAIENHFVEIQVRTVFEEAWSEIDHHIRYPAMTNDDVLNSFLLSFNTIAKSADEMGTFGLKLKNEIKERNDFKKLSETVGNRIGVETKIEEFDFRKETKRKIFDKSFLEGTWVVTNDDSEYQSIYYFKIIGDDLVVPYSYYGKEELTGQFYDIVYFKDTYFGKFEWLDNDDIFGYSFWKKKDSKTLIGGWSLNNDVPEIVRRDITKLINFKSNIVEVVISKISSDTDDFPPFVKKFFAGISKMKWFKSSQFMTGSKRTKS